MVAIVKSFSSINTTSVAVDSVPAGGSVILGIAKNQGTDSGSVLASAVAGLGGTWERLASYIDADGTGVLSTTSHEVWAGTGFTSTSGTVAVTLTGAVNDRTFTALWVLDTAGTVFLASADDLGTVPEVVAGAGEVVLAWATGVSTLGTVTYTPNAGWTAATTRASSGSSSRQTLYSAGRAPAASETHRVDVGGSYYRATLARVVGGAAAPAASASLIASTSGAVLIYVARPIAVSLGVTSGGVVALDEATPGQVQTTAQIAVTTGGTSILVGVHPAAATLTATTGGYAAFVSDEKSVAATLSVTTGGAATLVEVAGVVYTAADVVVTTGGSLALDVRASTEAHLSVSTGGSAWLQREWTRDPITGRGAYQLAVTDRAGTVLAQLSTAYLSRPIVDRLNDVDGTGSGTAFDVPISSDAHGSLRQYRELTVARGGHHLGTYVLLNPEDTGTGSSVPWQAAGLGHYFTKRRIGPARRTSLLAGEWRGGYRAGSIPAQAPKWSRVKSPAMIGPSLRVEGSTHVQQTVTRLGSDTTFAPGSWILSSAGKDEIRKFAKEVEVDRDATDLVDIAPPVITIEGHTDSVPDYGPGGNQGLSERRAKAVYDYLLPLVPEGTTLQWVGYGETRPIVPNQPGGTEANRRVDIIYPKMVSARGHRQYVEERLYYTNPSEHIKRNLTLVSWWWLESYKEPNADGSVLWLGRRAVGSGEAWEAEWVDIDAETPLATWTRSEVSIEIPADGREYEIVVRLTPPAGTIVYDEGATHLWADDALEFIDVDQADIVAALVQHAQDLAFDKDDLGITVKAKPTGVKRTKVYYWHDRQTIAECMEELLNVSDGLEVTWQTTPTSRTLVTHYPRAGQTTTATLHGYDDVERTVDDYRVSLNGQAAATTVIIQADGSGADREEGVATGIPADLDLVLEDVWTAEPGTHVGELAAQARRGHRHYAGQVPIVSATVRQELSDEWLDRVELGDVIDVDLPSRVKHVTGPHRVTARSLDPISDRVIYSPTVEV